MIEIVSVVEYVAVDIVGTAGAVGDGRTSHSQRSRDRGVPRLECSVQTRYLPALSTGTAAAVAPACETTRAVVVVAVVVAAADVVVADKSRKWQWSNYHRLPGCPYHRSSL